MHWTALLAKRFFPPEARVIDDVACIHCGYNLRGLRAMGYCPECNKQVGDSLFVLAKPAVVAAGLRAYAKGHLAVFGVLLGCMNLGALWPQVFSVGVLLLGAIWQAFGITELRFRASLENLPVISARLRTVFVLSMSYVALLLLWLLAILAVAYIPSIPAGVAGRVLGAMGLMWSFSWVVLLAASGWFGMALAAVFGYAWTPTEFRIQMGLVGLCGLAAIPVWLVLRSSLSPAAMLGTVAVLGIAPMLTVLVTSIGFMHLANAAEQTDDTMDEAVSSGRVAITPREPHEYRDTAKPIDLAGPKGRPQR